MFDPLKLATDLTTRDDDGRRQFRAQADDFYPAVLDAIADGSAPTNDGSDDARHYAQEVAVVRPLSEGIADARLTLDQLAEAAGSPEQLAARRVTRSRVLEVARRWFTNELHRAIGGGPLALKILDAAKRFRL